MAKNLKNIAVIGDKDTTLGFAIAGIKHIFYVETGQKATKDALESCLSNPEIGVVIITERVADSIRDDIDRLKMDKTLYPIIIEIPDKQGEIPGRKDPISLLIKRAIGVEVTKK
jgi:V/A-type H+-transporting ATPase subunit F